MKITNIEFKAKTTRLDELEKKLLNLDPEYIGLDAQIDTYFHVSQGRLKLREGNIENALIYYQRENLAGTKQSNVLLYKHNPDKSLKDILTNSNGVKIVVEKQRKIYRIENIKFHFDTIKELGTFVEVEAIDTIGIMGIEKLQEQCNHYINFLGITPADYISTSYSDLLFQQT